MTPLIRRRAMMKQGKPYDAEIEYLQSTGTQFIGTGLVHTKGYRYLIDIAVVTNDNKYRSIIGAATGGDNDKFYLSTVIGSPFSMYLNNIAITPVDIDIYSRLQLSVVQNNTTTILYHNANILGSARCLIFDLPVMLMARNSKNDKMIGRYYAFKAWDGNDILLKDFIPVRVGQVGYMYDKVSGQLFGNQGTGSFVLGNDL